MRLAQAASHGVLLHDGRDPVSAKASRALVEARHLARGIAQHFESTRNDYRRESERNKDARAFLERAARKAAELTRLMNELDADTEAAKAATAFAVGRLEGSLTAADLERARHLAASLKEQKMPSEGLQSMLTAAESSKDIARIFALSLLPTFAPRANAAMARLAAPGQAAHAAELAEDVRSVGTAVHALTLGLSMLEKMEGAAPGSTYQLKRPDPDWTLSVLHAGAAAILGAAGQSDPEALPQEPAASLQDDDQVAGAP